MIAVDTPGLSPDREFGTFYIYQVNIDGEKTSSELCRRKNLSAANMIPKETSRMDAECLSFMRNVIREYGSEIMEDTQSSCWSVTLLLDYINNYTKCGVCYSILYVITLLLTLYRKHNIKNIMAWKIQTILLLPSALEIVYIRTTIKLYMAIHLLFDPIFSNNETLSLAKQQYNCHYTMIIKLTSRLHLPYINRKFCRAKVPVPSYYF